MALRVVTKFGLRTLWDLREDLDKSPSPTWGVLSPGRSFDFVFQSLDLMNAYQHFPAPEIRGGAKEDGEEEEAGDKIIFSDPAFHQSLLQMTLAILMTKCLEQTAFFDNNAKEQDNNFDREKKLFIAKESQAAGSG